MQDFRKLKVWEKAHHLTLAIYKATDGFPKSELYGLTSQIRRSCSSIPANIAEGCVQDSDAQYARYLRISLGSASELDYHLILGKDLDFINEATYKNLNDELDQIKKMLASFIRKLTT